MMFLHVGLHKTGTTFLQKAVWPNWEGLYYGGKPYTQRPLEGFLRKSYKACLFSNEHFTTAPTPEFLVKRTGNDLSWAQHRYERINRLHAILPDASIILGLRNPPDLVQSLYSQYLIWGGHRDIEEFVSIDFEESTIRGDDLLFIPLLECIARKWNNVFVFDSDEIRDNLQGLVVDLGAFMGLSSLPNIRQAVGRNERIGQHLGEQLRLLNRKWHRGEIDRELHARSLNQLRENARGIHDKPIVLPEKLRFEIEDYTRNDWGKVRELIFQNRRSCE